MKRHKWLRLLFWVGGMLVFGISLAQEQQRKDLELMRVLRPTREPHGTSRGSYWYGRINAVDRTWEDWQKRTGELPPDFAAMPSIPFLPDPLAGVRTREDWPGRRAQLKQQIEKWITGRMPPPRTISVRSSQANIATAARSCARCCWSLGQITVGNYTSRSLFLPARGRSRYF